MMARRFVSHKLQVLCILASISLLTFLALEHRPAGLIAAPKHDTYLDSVYGFSLILPSEWYIHPATQDRLGSVTQIINGPVQVGDADSSSTSADYVKLELGVLTYDKPVDRSLDDWAAPDPHVASDLKQKQDVSIAGRNALRQDFDNGIASGALFLIPNGAKVYFIAVMPLTAVQNSDVAHLLQSFQIINPYSVAQSQVPRLYPVSSSYTESGGRTLAGYRLPFAGQHRITTGPGCSPTHQGRSAEAIDFQMDTGTAVYATQTGTVSFAAYGWNKVARVVKTPDSGFER